MKVKVSKVFADFINKTAKCLGFQAQASVVTMSERAYRVNVSTDIYAAEEHGDYDFVTGQAKAIRISYPDSYYAMPKYITTQELTREFRRRGVSTESELMQMVRNLCEI